ncbi:MAG: hypothetical protein JSU72_18840, partial [Deltaproteobacteria bacterium]
MIRKLFGTLIVLIVLAILLPTLTYFYVKGSCEKRFDKELKFFSINVEGKRLRIEFKEVGRQINIYAKDFPFGDYYVGKDIAGRRVLFDKVADNEFKEKLTNSDT